MVLQLIGSNVFIWCVAVLIQYDYRLTDRATTRGPIGPKNKVLDHFCGSTPAKVV